MKLAKLDPRPLRKALEPVKETQALVIRLRARQTELQTEVKNFLDTTDMENEAAVQLVSGRRMMGEMAGHQATRQEKELGPLIAKLVREIDKFEQALRAVAEAESAALLEKIAGLLRPYCRDFTSQGDRVDGAREVARRCQAFQAFPDGRALPPLPSHVEPSDYASIVECAETALALHDRLEKAGGFMALNFAPDAA